VAGTSRYFYLEANMKIAVAGSKNWNNYNELMRQLTIIIEEHSKDNPNDPAITFVHTGLDGAENMVTEYCGKVYGYLRQKGYNVKDQVFKPKSINIPDGYKKSKDLELLESGVDRAVVFIAAPNKRLNAFISMAELHNIPTIVVKG
jgi:hypothetical protein